MKRSELFFTLVLLPVDLLALMAASVAAFYSRFHPYFLAQRPVSISFDIGEYLSVAALIAFIWLGIFAIAGLYGSHRRALAVELTRVFLACSAGIAAVFAILFFSRTFFESRFIAVAAWLLSILFVGAARITVRLVERALLRFGIGEHRVVLIGSTKTGDVLSSFFKTHHRYGFHVVGRFAKFDDEARHAILALKAKDQVDEIFLVDPEATRKDAFEILSFTDTEHLGFRYAADLFTAAAGRSIIHTFTGIPVIEVQKTPLDGWGAIFKRIFDIVGSIFLIILTLPIQIVVAIALFIEQPGRVFFSRLPDGKKVMRVGEGGRPFHYFKFRSMIKNAHSHRFDPEFVKKHGNMREGTPLFKLKDDPRVTRVGAFLRRYSLDELPEFYLVLLGRMSLVGPRPHLPEEVAQYKPHQRKVMTIKPGITGVGQISGRADLDFDEEIRLDVSYIERWSPWLDLYILLKTPFAVLFRKGAY